MIRINLHPDARVSKFKTPIWFDQMVKDMIGNFSQEYQISSNDCYAYFFQRTGDCSRLAATLKEFIQLDATTYNIEYLPSWGLLLKDDDPVVVEYKLKYGEGSD